MKNIIISVVIMLMVSTLAIAQVPTDMMYQVMVFDNATGQIKSEKDVTIKIELRQGSSDGNVAWSKEYATTTNKSGICNLTLPFSDNIDWDHGPYYLAVIIDGEQCGAPKLTSVPYAIKAKYLEGAITREELIGTWEPMYYSSSDKEFIVSTHDYPITFNEDGTFIWSYSKYEYYYDNSGSIVIFDDYKPKIRSIVRIAENRIAFDYDTRSIYQKK